MAYETRTVRADELGAWLACMGTAFFNSPSPQYAEWFARSVDLDRVRAAIDEGRVVGTMRSFPVQLTVPGPATLTASALTNVTVEPTHRRRGLLTSMITAELRATAEREEPVGILVASEWSIYGRFGYGPAIEVADFHVDARRARFLRRPPGSVELVDEGTLCAVGPAIYDRYRLSQPGAIERAAPWWERNVERVRPPAAGDPTPFRAVYRGEAGELEGFLRYQVKPEWEAMISRAVLTVEDLCAVTTAAWEALWGFICSVDLVAEVRARRRRVDEPLALLLEDGRAARQSDRYDFIWARIFDVCATLAARRYFAEGGIVLAVADPLGYATGRYRFDAGPDGATCTATNASPELSLGVDALASLFLGGWSAQALAQAGRIEEHRSGAVDTASRLLGTPRPPWCDTSF